MHVNFQFKDYIAKLIGVDPGKLQEISSNPEAQCPDILAVEELYNSFKRWKQQPGGADKPKLLFLMDCKQCNYPLVTVAAATVDSL